MSSKENSKTIKVQSGAATLEISHRQCPKFDTKFVIAKTLHFMRRDLAVSQQKSFARITDFSPDSKESEAIFRTMVYLQGLSNILDSFEANVELNELNNSFNKEKINEDLVREVLVKFGFKIV